MLLGLFFVGIGYIIGIWSFPPLSRFIVNLIILTGLSFLTAYYWESKREAYFWRGFIVSVIFSPFAAAAIGWSFDRFDILGKKSEGAVLNELMMAAVEAKPNIIQNIIAGGANPQQKTPSKRTALMIAAESNPYPQVCTILCQAGTDVDSRDREGKTALMYAAMNNDNHHITEAIIKEGADPNIQDNQGATALMYAAYNNPEPKVIDVLLQAGANPKILDNDGSSVFDYAYKIPNKPILESAVLTKLRRVTLATLKHENR